MRGIRDRDCITLATEKSDIIEPEPPGVPNIPLPEYAAPSAPPPEYDMFNNNEPSEMDNNAPSAPLEESDALRKESRVHYIYSIELIIFAFIGWAWLAIREYLGNTPVMDATVVIVNIVTAFVNLAAVLVFPEPHAFISFARAHFSHSFTLWVFYLYSLVESMAIGDVNICCGQDATTVSVPLARTQAAAYFGGLQFHQAPGMLTLSFLTVSLLISAAQARNCAMNNEGDVDSSPKSSPSWTLLRGTGATIAIFVSLHCILFTFHAPLCKSWAEFSGITGYVAFMTWAMMIDLYWVYSLIWKVIDHTIPVRVKTRLIFHIADFATVLLLLILTTSLAAVVGNVFPVASTFLLMTEVISFAVLFWIDIFDLRASYRREKHNSQTQNVMPPGTRSKFSTGQNYNSKGKKRW